LVASFSSPRSSGSPASESGRRGRPRALWLWVHRAVASVGRASGTRRVVVLLAAPTASARLPVMTPAITTGGPTTGPRTVGRRSTAIRHTLLTRRRVTRRLYSSYMGASNDTPLLHRPPPRSSTLTSHGPTSSSAKGGASTPALLNTWSRR
jgi:hypothetical protein